MSRECDRDLLRCGMASLAYLIPHLLLRRRAQYLPQFIQRPSLPRPPIQQPDGEQQMHQPELDRRVATTDIPRLHPAVATHECSDSAARDCQPVVAESTRERAVHHGLDLLPDGVVRRAGRERGLSASDLVGEEFGFDGAGHEGDDLRVC